MPILPFERNRYYYGKMLTSADFRAEQKYMNGKREFLNQMVLGTGVLCGMGVLNLDDLSVLVESGAAVDADGKEIVVQQSVVKKLSALPGYTNEGVKRFSLCIRHKEEEAQPVYAVNRKEDQQEYENNRISESYEIFLADAAELEQEFRLDSEFFVETELLSTTDYRVTLKLPAVACKGRRVRISMEIRKLSSHKKALELSYDLQLPAFLTKDESHLLKIREQLELLEAGEKQNRDYWLYCMQSDLKESSILIKPLKKQKEQELKVRLTGEEPDGLILRELARPGLEMRNGNRPEVIRLADLYMKHTDLACVIERVDESVRQYIPLPSEENQKNLYESFYDTGDWIQPLRKPESEWKGEKQIEAEPAEKTQTAEKEQAAEKAQTAEEQTVQQTLQGQMPEMSCGILEIPLEERMKKGAVCYSKEIIHGLGPGSVYVSVGLDEEIEGVGSRRSVPSVIYGNPELFAEQNPAGTCVETAVKVWEERGSFQAAAKLCGEQNTVLLTMHWIAWKYPPMNRQDSDEKEEQGWIAPESAAVSLRPGEKHFFGINFYHMRQCALRYEVTGEDAGFIDEDGTYTAPKREGVYEIKISCEEHPEICTYAYAVVER